jgi:hypothetical protein
VIKNYKLAEQTASYTPNPSREEYVRKEVKEHAAIKCVASTVEVCQAAN